MQFDHPREPGLSPRHRLLDIGCGNLRAGRLLIDCLDAGHHYGIDISPDILIAAKRTVTERGLQSKLPYLTLTHDLTFDFLPDRHFDVVHAHSVFSHSPLEVVDECLANVARIVAPGGWFDEDFHYRTETPVELAARHRLTARFMDDGELRGHGQSKIRVHTGSAPPG